MNFNIYATISLITIECTVLYGVLLPTPLRSRTDIARIVGGHEAIPHSHPYLVSLQYRFLWSRSHFCGGTLIKRSWILTAGHCFVGNRLARWLPVEAIAGVHHLYDLDPKSTIINPVSKKIVHPLYESKILKNDIALLKTDFPFEWKDNIQPAYLPKGFSIESDILELSGWGALSTTWLFPNKPKKLQEVTLTYVPFNECYKVLQRLGEESYLDEKAHLCTGPLDGGISGCNGDSGGPLIYYKDIRKHNDDSNYKMHSKYKYDEYGTRRKQNFRSPKTYIPVVVGITSWVTLPCGMKGAPTVFANVSNYLDFINEHIDAE